MAIDRFAFEISRTEIDAMSLRMSWARCAVALTALAAALAVDACANSYSAAPYAYQSDPALQSHWEWCANNPPSGYCTTAEPF